MTIHRKNQESKNDLLSNLSDHSFDFGDADDYKFQGDALLAPYQYISISLLDDITRSIAAIGGPISPDSAPLESYFQSRAEEIYQEVTEYFQSSEWGKPCRNMFKWLANNDPDMLIKTVLHGRLERTLLTFAAESIGRINDPGTVFSILRPMLAYNDALVREGVVYGLSKHVNKIYVSEALTERLVEEDVKGVRIAIMEALDLE